MLLFHGNLDFRTVLPTRPIYRQTADFEGLRADEDFTQIGSRFFADKKLKKIGRI